MHFIYYTTSGQSLNQEGVYVTSRSFEHMLLTYYLRTLACKWFDYSTWLLFCLYIFMRMLMDYDFMLFVICVLTDVIDEFPWVCRRLDGLWMPRASMDLLGLWIEWGSGLHWFEYFIYAYVTYDWVYYDVVYGSMTMFCWWINADDFLLI